MDLAKHVNGLKYFHLILCLMLMAIIFIIGFVLQPVKNAEMSFDLTLYTGLSLGIGILALLGAYLVFQRKLDRLGGGQIDSKAMEQFKADYTGKWALILGGSLVNILMYFLEGNKLLFIFSLVLLILLYLSKPKLTVNYS